MNKFKKYIAIHVFILLGLACVTTACDDPYEDSMYVNDDNLPPLALTLSSDSAATEWVKVMKFAGMYDALNYALDPFTVFYPSNEALDSFYAVKGVTSVEELGYEYARDLVKTHTILDSLKTDDIIKKEFLTNLAEERLYVYIDTMESGNYYFVNQAETSTAHVEMTEVKAYNGYINRINTVINPLNQSVYDLLTQSGMEGGVNRFAIMDAALKATGWADSLDIINDTIWLNTGNYNVNRRQYTLLAVSDEVFRKDGIESFEQLCIKVGSTGDYTDLNNELNKYVAYHILKSASSWIDLSSLLNVTEVDEETGEECYVGDSVKLMDTSAEGLILQYSRIGREIGKVAFVFNAQAESAQLLEGKYNILAKNGYLHELDGYLPVWEPEQTTVLWDLADYASVKTCVEKEEVGLYKPTEPVTTECKVALQSLTDVYTYEVSPNGAGTSYYPVTYVNCKKNLKDANNLDRVVFNVGYMGWVEMKTPTLVRGKYRVELDFVYMLDQSFMRTMADGNGGLLKMTFDGENEALVSPYTTVPKNSLGVYSTVLYDEIEFETTANHLMKFIVMDPAASTNGKFSLQFDCIRFIPITE